MFSLLWKIECDVPKTICLIHQITIDGCDEAIRHPAETTSNLCRVDVSCSKTDLPLLKKRVQQCLARPWHAGEQLSW